MARAPTSTIRRRRWEARRAELNEAATAQLAASGFDGFTLVGLAAKLDIAVGGLYRYFRSKDALLAEILLTVMDDLGDRFRRVTAPPGIDSVLALAAAYLDYRERRPQRFALFQRMIAEPRALVADEEMQAVLGRALPILVQIGRPLYQAEVAGQITKGSVQRRTLQLWAAIQGALSLAKLARFRLPELPTADLVDPMIDDLLASWGASRAQIAAARRRLTDTRTAAETTPRPIDDVAQHAG